MISQFFTLNFCVVQSELLILNQAEKGNLPVLFDWSEQSDTHKFVKNFKNPTKLEVRNLPRLLLLFTASFVFYLSESGST